MKESGMVRRVDELGRLVIPKEIRRNMNIKTGDEIEMYLSDGNIVLKKYSKMENMQNLLSTYVFTLAENYMSAMITDKEKVLVNKNKNGEILDGKSLTNKVCLILENRIGRTLSNNEEFKTVEGELGKYEYQYVLPICFAGDVYGSIILQNNDPFDDTDLKVVEFLSRLIEKEIA